MSDSMPPSTLASFIPEGDLLDAGAILERFLAWVETTGLTPYPAQEEALLELAVDRHVILSTPTGSGKSLVALGLHFRALCQGKRSFYTAPIKALVSERFFDFCENVFQHLLKTLAGTFAEGSKICATLFQQLLQNFCSPFFHRFCRTFAELLQSRNFDPRKFR